MKQYKLELFKPTGEYLGELIAHNVEITRMMSEISALSFTLPQYIDGELNPRLLEIQDRYEVLLSFGPNYSNKHLFVINRTPMEFSEDGNEFKYEAVSPETLLKKQIVFDWPGVKRETYYRKIETAKSDVQVELDPHIDLDTFSFDVFAVREDYDGIRKTIPLGIITDKNSPYMDQNGFYYLDKENRMITIFIGNESDVKNIQKLKKYYYKIYDNPTGEELFVSYNGATNTYISEKPRNETETNKTTKINNKTYHIEEYFTNDAITLEEVINSIYNDSGFSFIIPDHLKNIKKGGFEWNNIDKFSILEEIIESYEVDYIIEEPYVKNNKLHNHRTIRFFDENEGINQGLTFSYGGYLQSLNKDINYSNIVTSITAAGKDGLNVSLLLPNGQFWEDYTFYLDDYIITPENSNILTASTIDHINFITEEGMESRWFSKPLAKKLAIWHYIKNEIHNILLGEKATTIPSVRKILKFDLAHYFNGYQNRLDIIKKLGVLETEYDTIIINRNQYKLLMEATENELNELKESAGKTAEIEDLMNTLNTYEKLYIKFKEEGQEKEKEIKDVLEDLYYSLTISKPNNAAIFEDVRSILDRTNPIWKISYEENLEILKYKTEYVLIDSGITNEIDLLKEMIKYLDKHKFPEVTISIDTVDFVSAIGTEIDAEKLKLGDKVNIYFPDFNIDLEAQIRTFTYSLDNNDITLTIATSKNYNQGFSFRLLKNINSLGTIDKNIVKTNQIQSKIQKEQYENLIERIEGASASDMYAGIQTADGKSTVIIGGEGIKSNDIKVNHDTHTITVLQTDPEADEDLTNELILTNGAIRSVSKNTMVEMSSHSGFNIYKIRRNPVSNLIIERTPVMSVDKDGNAFFAGVIRQGSTIEFSGGSGSIEDLFQYTANITGGTRTISYSKDGEPTPSTSSEFKATPKIGTKNWPHYDIQWTAYGRMTGTAEKTNKFIPEIQKNYKGEDTYIEVKIDFFEDSSEQKIINTIIEQVGVSIVKEGESGPPGKPGEPGSDGKPGEDAISSFLTQPSYIIPTKEGEPVIDATSNTKGQIKVYQGVKDITTSSEVKVSQRTINLNGLQLIINESSKTYELKITDKTKIQKTNTFEINLTYQDIPIKLIFTAILSERGEKGKDGEHGKDPITLDILANKYLFVKNIDKDNLILTLDVNIDDEYIYYLKYNNTVLESDTNTFKILNSHIKNTTTYEAWITTKENSTEIAKDRVTITVIDKPKDGLPGDSALNIVITNPYITIPLRTDDKPAKTEYTTEVYVYRGGVVETDWNITVTSPDYITTTIRGGSIDFKINNDPQLLLPLNDIIRITAKKGNETIQGSIVVSTLYSKPSIKIISNRNMIIYDEYLSLIDPTKVQFTIDVSPNSLDNFNIKVFSDTGYEIEGGTVTVTSNNFPKINNQTVFEIELTHKKYGYIINDTFILYANRQGPRGPGLKFRGTYSDNTTYFIDEFSADVVRHKGNTYIRIGTIEAITGIAPDTSQGETLWSKTSSFENIATGALIAQRSYVRESLNIGGDNNGYHGITLFGGTGGESSLNPYISIGQISQAFNQNGIYIGKDNNRTVFSLKSSNGNGLNWDSVSGDLNVTGNVNAKSGTIGDFSLDKGMISYTGNAPYLSDGRMALNIKPTYIDIQAIQTTRDQIEGALRLQSFSPGLQTKDWYIGDYVSETTQTLSPSLWLQDSHKTGSSNRAVVVDRYGISSYVPRANQMWRKDANLNFFTQNNATVTSLNGGDILNIGANDVNITATNLTLNTGLNSLNIISGHIDLNSTTNFRKRISSSNSQGLLDMKFIDYTRGNLVNTSGTIVGYCSMMAMNISPTQYFYIISGQLDRDFAGEVTVDVDLSKILNQRTLPKLYDVTVVVNSERTTSSGGGVVTLHGTYNVNNQVLKIVSDYTGSKPSYKASFILTGVTI